MLLMLDLISHMLMICSASVSHKNSINFLFQTLSCICVIVKQPLKLDLSIDYYCFDLSQGKACKNCVTAAQLGRENKCRSQIQINSLHCMPLDALISRRASKIGHHLEE